MEYLGPSCATGSISGAAPGFIVNHPNEGQARLARGARSASAGREQAIHRLHTVPPSGLNHERPHSASLP